MNILTHETIERFLLRHPQSATVRPVAIFDCDGTVIRGDAGEAMLFYQLDEFQFRHSPAEVWPDHPERTRLDEAFQTLVPLGPGERTTSPAWGTLATMVLDWYFGQINDGRVIKACADIVRLLAGFTLPEVRAMAEASFARELHLPLGTRQMGRHTVPTGLRFIEESSTLLRALRDRGFTIWAVSGSNKWSVEPVFTRLGIAAEQVIGLEMFEQHGLLTAQEVTPIPVRQGKVDAMRLRIPGTPVLAASDSRNDIPFLLYSSDVKVRVNSRGRSTEEFFDAVGSGPDASWVNIEQPTIIMNGA